jgi:hypothetical protein
VAKVSRSSRFSRKPYGCAAVVYDRVVVRVATGEEGGAVRATLGLRGVEVLEGQAPSSDAPPCYGHVLEHPLGHIVGHDKEEVRLSLAARPAPEQRRPGQGGGAHPQKVAAREGLG